MSAISDLAEYVQEHAIRGTCKCGKCVDHPGEDKQPEGHTVDVFFFEVANKGGNAEELRALVEAAKDGEFCNVDVFDGKDHGYMELGGWIGDQGMAMMLMGLGEILGLWKVFTPKMLGVPDDLANQMAGMGMVSVSSR